MGGKSSRDKGQRGELELMHLLDGARIRGRVLTARKVSRAGYSETDLMVGDKCYYLGLREDVGTGVCPPDCDECAGTGHRINSEEMVEVKRRAQGFKKIYEFLQNNYAVCFRGDREEWIICLRLKDLIE